MSINASDARAKLFPLIKQVNDDHAPVRITSRHGDTILMSAEDYDSWEETIYLLRSPRNAQLLMEAVAWDKARRSKRGASASQADADATLTTEELDRIARSA